MVPELADKCQVIQQAVRTQQLKLSFVSTGLTPADLVWNRALTDEPGNGVGDQHLYLLAKPFGRIMNGGTAAAEDTCSAEEILRAADAFDYLELADLAELTRRLVDGDFSNGREQRRNRAFFGLSISLNRAFERRYALAPQDFDPPTVPAGSAAGHGPDDAQPLPREAPTCTGTAIVHELDNTCTLGAACAHITRGFIEHDHAVLHHSPDCPLCPSGSDWAR